MMRFWNNLVNKVRCFFQTRYFLFVQFMAFYLVALSGRVMRRYLVLLGKDPDYVPLPPPPLPEPTVEDIFLPRMQPPQRNRPSVGLAYMATWVAPSMKDGKLHPVTKLRLEALEKQKLKDTKAVGLAEATKKEE